jgi:hypothetical protein
VMFEGGQIGSSGWLRRLQIGGILGNLDYLSGYLGVIKRAVAAAVRAEQTASSCVCCVVLCCVMVEARSGGGNGRFLCEE